MYDIFTCIWLIFMGNVGKYTIHGSYGICFQWFKSFRPSASEGKPKHRRPSQERLERLPPATPGMPITGSRPTSQGGEKNQRGRNCRGNVGRVEFYMILNTDLWWFMVISYAFKFIAGNQDLSRCFEESLMLYYYMLYDFASHCYQYFYQLMASCCLGPGGLGV